MPKFLIFSLTSFKRYSPKRRLNPLMEKKIGKVKVVRVAEEVVAVSKTLNPTMMIHRQEF
jgi:hypothetical protein